MTASHAGPAASPTDTTSTDAAAADAWQPPRYLPVWVDPPDVPPPHRVAIREDMTPLQLMLSVIRSGGRYAAGGCLLLIAFNTASMLVPVALGAAIDRGIAPVVAGADPADAAGTFALWLLVIAGLYLLINLTYRFGGRMGWYSVQRAKYELSARVMERILDPRGMVGPPPLPGRLLSVATLDVQRVCLSLYFAIYPLGQLVSIVVAAVSLFVIHPILGWTVTIGAPLLLGIMALVAKPLHARSLEEQEAVADAAGVAADLMAGYRVLSGIHARAAAAGLYRGVSRKALRGTVAAGTADAALVGTNTLLSGLFAGGVTVTAAVLTFNGSIGIGGLIAAAALAQLLLDPLRELIQTAGQMGAIILASARRLLDLLAIERHSFGERDVPDAPTMQLRLPGSTEAITITPGDFVALDVPGSAADAAIAAMALITPAERAGGDAPALAIDLDDRPLTAYAPAEVRRVLLVSPHESDLLESTVIDNVTRQPERDLSVAEATAALEVAACGSLRDELSMGFDTRVADGGRTLSGGQRQRVALARAVARDPSILVLHSPTNAVDSVTEVEIAHRLHRHRKGRTTVVFTSARAFHTVADRSIMPAGESE